MLEFLFVALCLGAWVFVWLLYIALMAVAVIGMVLVMLRMGE